MTNPEWLIYHHGADARVLTLAEMRRIYQETHYTNLYLKYDQPRSTGDWPDIAYHILVGSDGWSWQRDPSIAGYHASNYQVNTNGLGLCISGNYDRMTISAEMDQYVREATADAKKRFPSLKYTNPHRAYANKTCPGGTITDEFIKSVFEDPLPQQGDNKKAIGHLGAALVDIQKAVKELS